jgi:hypothetical protein
MRSDAFQAELEHLTKLLRGKGSSVSTVTIENVKISLEKLFSISHVAFEDVVKGPNPLSEVSLSDVQGFLSKLPPLEFISPAVVGLLAILSRHDDFLHAIWDKGILTGDRVNYSQLSTLNSATLRDLCFIIYQVICKLGPSAHTYFVRQRDRFLYPFYDLCMQDNLWTMDCIEHVVVLAARFAQIPGALENNAPELLRVFVRFVYHPEPSVCAASIFAIAGILNRQPILRSEPVFTTEGGTILFDHLAWVGCQDGRHVSDAVAKLFAVLLKRPHIEVIGCHQIASMITMVIASERPRVHVLELLRIAVFNPQFVDEELADEKLLTELCHRYPTFTLKEKVAAGYVFAGLLAQLPYEAIRSYLLNYEDGMCYFSEALEDLLEVEVDEQESSPVCPILDGFARVLDMIAVDPDGYLLRNTPFISETLNTLLESLGGDGNPSDRICRVVECVRTKLAALWSESF